MELLIPVKQKLLMEWNISFNQYAIVYLISKLKDWAEKKEYDGKIYYFLTKTKVFEELPCGTNERNVVRNIKKLIEYNLIEKEIIRGRTFYRLSDNKGSKIYEKTAEKITNEGVNSKVEAIEFTELFEKFWFLFPRKSSKDEAVAAFKILTSDEQQKAITAAKIYAETSQEVDAKFITLAKNWLKNKNFNDEEYNYKEINETTKQNDNISAIVYKIQQVLAKYRKLQADKKQEYLQNKITETQLKEGGEFFTFEEKEMLNEIGYTIDNYDDIEFQEGEIESNFRGYFG
ncbi:MAG: hypothetical protein ACI81I_000085 [Arcobacteraceae bacterium]|jgi:hypothetical protein